MKTQDPMEIVDSVVSDPPSQTAQALKPQTADSAPLANRKAPHYFVQQERPVHRLMLEYAAQGYNVKEIAEMTGHTPVNVNNILRQPHAQQTLVNTIRKNATVDDEVVEIVKQNVVASAKLYQEILSDPKASRAEKMEVAERFLCRRYGKPTQPMAKGTIVDLNTLTDDELAAMLQTNGTGTNH